MEITFPTNQQHEEFTKENLIQQGTTFYVAIYVQEMQ